MQNMQKFQQDSILNATEFQDSPSTSDYSRILYKSEWRRLVNCRAL